MTTPTWTNYFPQNPIRDFEGRPQLHKFACVGAIMELFATSNSEKRDAEIARINNSRAEHMGSIMELQNFLDGQLFDGDYTDFLKTHSLDSSKLIAVSSDGPYGLHAIVIYRLIDGIVSFYCPYENEYYETSAELFMTHAKPKSMFIGDKDSTTNSSQCETTSLYETPKKRGYVGDEPLKRKKKFEYGSPKKLF
jgi:hypothetical protein